MIERANLKKNALTVLQGNWTNAVLGTVICMAISAIPSATGIGGIISLIIGGPIALGMAIYFLKLATNESPKIDNFFDGFKNFLQSFILYILQIVFICLWALLLIIPGIVKAFSYSMAFYIMADNPEITASDALKESMRITNGYKMDLFVLCLSFTGWFILCMFTFGIGYFWLLPYMQTTFAGAYKKLSAPKIIAE
ncbi:MAG: hypothetical protein A2015_00955 [Spirochaetes bacterium GWF1_31_7]|nr:MAG: hypothetical protein A2Y30_12815 [Spirochaetes bacterium GWE1_32_154]OHD51687.1 MAG: hypothetical protein A2Y29_04615 [Spirochaetes bacterium GWE2_31_10]OHD51940.1 MAG: hypothetical protein A2015_00955 [Spirochaetes bacterium GWF1_31_7]HBD93025.1 hypothetical protein [Spirochaetia bacterium]